MSFPTDGFEAFEVYRNISVESPNGLGFSFTLPIQATAEWEEAVAALDAGVNAIVAYFETNHPTWEVTVFKQLRGYKNT